MFDEERNTKEMTPRVKSQDSNATSRVSNRRFRPTLREDGSVTPPTIRGVQSSREHTRLP